MRAASCGSDHLADAVDIAALPALEQQAVRGHVVAFVINGRTVDAVQRPACSAQTYGKVEFFVAVQVTV